MAKNPVDRKVGDVLDSLETKLFLARQEYDKYFLGVLKKEPTDKRDELQMILRELTQQQFLNTAQNFRFQQLKARYTSMSLYWLRLLKKQEDGTLPRNLFHQKLLEREAQEQKVAEKKHSDEATRAEQRRQTQQDSIADGSQMKSLFDQFLDIRQRCNERTDNVRFDNMVEFMKQQTQALKDRFQCRAVKFEVVEDNGKAKLKAIPVK